MIFIIGLFHGLGRKVKEECQNKISTFKRSVRKNADNMITIGILLTGLWIIIAATWKTVEIIF